MDIQEAGALIHDTLMPRQNKTRQDDQPPRVATWPTASFPSLFSFDSTRTNPSLWPSRNTRPSGGPRLKHAWRRALSPNVDGSSRTRLGRRGTCWGHKVQYCTSTAGRQCLACRCCWTGGKRRQETRNVTSCLW
jgi:hypothetical protein